jgi:hypothetical protein
MKTLLTTMTIVLLSLAGCASNGGPSTGPVAPDKVVYHLNDGLPQATISK